MASGFSRPWLMGAFLLYLVTFLTQVAHFPVIDNSIILYGLVCGNIIWTVGKILENYEFFSKTPQQTEIKNVPWVTTQAEFCNEFCIAQSKINIELLVPLCDPVGLAYLNYAKCII